MLGSSFGAHHRNLIYYIIYICLPKTFRQKCWWLWVDGLDCQARTARVSNAFFEVVWKYPYATIPSSWKRFWGPVCKQKLCSWCFRFPAQCCFKPLLYNNLYAHSQWIDWRQRNLQNNTGFGTTRALRNTFGPFQGFDDWHETEYVLGCHSRWQTGSFKLDSEQCDTHPVSQLWRHTGGRSFAAAFFFSSWHTARLRIKFQNGSFYLSENNGKKQQNVLQSKIWTHRRTLSFATGVFKYTMLTIALGKAVASLWSAGRDLQAMDVKWPAPVDNTFDKPCVWPFLESCGYWSEKWAFQQIKLDKFGTCKGTGNWMRAAQKRTTWRISQTKLSFSVPKWSRTIFGVIWFHPACAIKWAACGDTGFICSFIFRSWIPSFLH